ncbi:MAG: PEP-CTERM sorting domain-containing protein [Burkholderiales bacterium]
MAPFKSLLLSIVAMAITGSAGAQAPSLTPLQFSLQAQSQSSDSAGLVSSGAFSAVGGGGPRGPAVAVHGTGQERIASADNEASARALWSFEILGPAGVTVPILIGGLYSASYDGGGYASGGLALGEDRFRMTYVMTFRCSSSTTADCDSSNGNHSQGFVLKQSALSGYETFISISAGGVLRGDAGDLGTFNAMLDPLITIDPSFARASEFTLFVSPGAEAITVAAVPEPDSWLLLLAGAATMAGVARRRQRAPR